MAGFRLERLDRPSDIPGVVAILILQTISLRSTLSKAFFCRDLAATCSSPDFLGWRFLRIGFTLSWLLLTAALERTRLYCKLRSTLLCLAYLSLGALNATDVSNYHHLAWQNTLLGCLLPGLVNALAHKTSDQALVARLSCHILIFSVVLLSNSGLAISLTTVPVLVSVAVSGGLISALWWNIPVPEGAASVDTGIGLTDSKRVKATENGSLEDLEEREKKVIRAKGIELQNGNGFTDNVSCVFEVALYGDKNVLLHSKVSYRDGSDHQKDLVGSEQGRESGEESLKEAGPSKPKFEVHQNRGSGSGGDATPQGEPWGISAAVGDSGGRSKRERKKKALMEKARKRAPAEVAIVMGAEVSRLVSVSKVMEIDDAQEFIVRAQVIMSDTAVRAMQENARFDTRIAKPVTFSDEVALGVSPLPPATAPTKSQPSHAPQISPTSSQPSTSSATASPPSQPSDTCNTNAVSDTCNTNAVSAQPSDRVGAKPLGPSWKSTASGSGRPPLPTGPRGLPPDADVALTRGSEKAGCPEADEGRLYTSLYERAERCVNRLGYEWAALKWEESQVEVRALGALKEAVLARKSEDEVMQAVNLVRDARRGLAMLATASSRCEPWRVLERRGCRGGLLFGPLWVTPLLAKDAGRAAWVAAACGTEGLVGESVDRVFPRLGMGQGQALAAACRDMERVEFQLEADLAKLRVSLGPWLRGAPVDPASVTGLVLGNLGEEVELLAFEADELQLQLFEHCKRILTPLQLATLLLALMDQRMRLQRLGSFWESVAAGQDVMTGVRKLTGRMATLT